MKKIQLLLVIVVLAMTAGSCKKSSNSTTNTNPAQQTTFMKFTFDGVPKDFEATGSDAYFFGNRLETYVGMSDNGIMVIDDYTNLYKDSLVNLLGRKLPLAGSGVSGQFKGKVFFDASSGDYYDSESVTSNPFPANYFKLNNITHLKMETNSMYTTDIYLLEGEFACNVSNGGADKHISNGTFKLVGFVYTY